MTEKRWVVAPEVANDIENQLLVNRGLTDPREIELFLNPPTPRTILNNPSAYLQNVDFSEIGKALSLIRDAAASSRPIVIHGDYDVDGLCGTVILYQTLRGLGAKVVPFIPDRFSEGYGLSLDSLDNVQQLAMKQFSNLTIPPLLITTDCGITATEETLRAKDLGFDVIITDHHIKGSTVPQPDSLVWTDELAGAGIAWLLSSLLKGSDKQVDDLDLVALATIADLQPLLGVNRALTKAGLLQLNQTQNIGLKELIKAAGIEGKTIGTYEVGWILAPRLNASGRLQHALDSLNLLITANIEEAKMLSAKLNQTNVDRQDLLKQTLGQAREKHLKKDGSEKDLLIFLSGEGWHEGIIGLMAGKIKEEFYRPTVIISRGEKLSKGSARSVEGFNIVEAIRECSEFLVSAGGHKMAAGFTVETERIVEFSEKLGSVARAGLSQELLTPTLSIDAEIDFSRITPDLVKILSQFKPFGAGNREPLFLTRNVEVVQVRTVGRENRHLKLFVRGAFSAIGFGMGSLAGSVFPGDKIDIVYHLDEDVWNGNKYLQLRLVDLKPSAAL